MSEVNSYQQAVEKLATLKDEASDRLKEAQRLAEEFGIPFEFYWNSDLENPLDSMSYPKYESDYSWDHSDCAWGRSNRSWDDSGC